MATMTMLKLEMTTAAPTCIEVGVDGVVAGREGSGRGEAMTAKVVMWVQLQ